MTAYENLVKQEKSGKVIIYKTMTKLKEKIVFIKFLDNETRPAWTHLSQIDDKTAKINFLYAVGYFVKKGEYFTIIAMGKNKEGGLLNVQMIPNGCILEIKTL